MKTMKKGNRVQSKANPFFKGIVIESSADFLSGYVHFDSDDNENERTFFHVSELEEETSAKPIR